MKLSRKNWNSYVTRLSAINKTAGKKMEAWIAKHGTDDVEALIEYAYALTTRYGEAASAAACQMYDEIADIQQAHVPPAEPKPTQHINYVDKAIRSTLDRAPSTVPSTVSEMVKRTGAETTLKNAQRDGAYFAWVPDGDTCAFCLTLASNGWRKASRKTINGDHAEHIHKNCNCEFAISFNGPGQIEGYDPDKYLDMYEGAEGNSWKDKVNSMRRAHYAANKDMINAQKREAYTRRKALQSNDARSIMNIDTGGKRNDITLTKEQFEAAKEYAVSLGMPPERVYYSEYHETGYGPLLDSLIIGTDAYPSPTATVANGKIGMKGAIAHEIIGHREVAMHGRTHFNKGDPLDEAQASIRAARFAPDLSPKERYYLLRDAIDRLHNAGYSIREVKHKMLDINER